MPEFTIQRFRGGYAVVYFDGDGRRRREKLAAPDRIGAEAEARQRWKLGDRSVWTVGRCVTAYLDQGDQDGRLSITRQRDAWRALEPYWRDVSPTLVDREMAQTYAAKRDRAPATVRYELNLISIALRWAAAEGRIAAAPTIWRPAPPPHKARHLTKDQFERWFAAVEAPHARLFALLAIYTTSRPTALLQLTWDRVDFDKRTITLNPTDRTQTRKRRPVVPINDDLFEALQAASEARQCDHVIEWGGRPVKTVKKAFAAASARSGVRFVPFATRSTAAVWAAEAGTPMSELAQLMGHTTSATTETYYARYSPDYLRAAVNSIQRAK